MADREGAPVPYWLCQDERLRAAGLTEMEQMILDRLAAGRTGWQICRELGISRALYQRYLQMVRRYLGVRTTTEAVAVWVRYRAELQSFPES